MAFGYGEPTRTDGSSAPRTTPPGPEMMPIGLRLARSFGAVVGTTLAIFAFLVAESFVSRRHAGPDVLDDAPEDSGLFGIDYVGEPIRLTILGDSNAAGVGATRPDETVGSHLAHRLADAAQLPVEMRNVAFAGAQTSDLDDQVGLVAEDGWPDVCLIVIGGNDVLHLRSITRSSQLLAATITRLRSHGTEVVVATCPDMGAERPLLQPLRLIAGRYGRLLSSSQTIAALRAGARTVSLIDTLGPTFRRFSTEMFAADRFHPSPVGYERAAKILLPSVRAAAARFVPSKKPYPHRAYLKREPRARTRLAFWLTRRSSLGQMSRRTGDIRH